MRPELEREREHGRWFGAAAALLLAALLACGDRDAPRPVPAFDESGSLPGRVASEPVAPDVRAIEATPAPAPAWGARPADQPDPAEPGIPDLVRLARYVYREMQLREATCTFGNPFHDTLSFTIETEVKGGRIVRARVGEAVLERGPERLPVPGGKPPVELVAYVSCLEPSLVSLVMAPAPADGVYEPVYAYAGHAGS